MKGRFYGNKPYKAAVIHGGPGALGSVAAIARELSKDFGVIEPLQTKSSISELLLEMDDILSAHWDGPLTLIGHSWGAWLTFIYAAEYPQKVNRAILVGSGPFEIQYVADIDKRRMEHLTPPEIGEYHTLLAGLESAEGGEPTESAATDKAQWMKRLGELVEKADNYCPVEIATQEEDCFPARGDLYSVLWAEASQWRRSGKLLGLADKITCPVTVIHGEDDPHPWDGVKIPLEKKIKDLRLYKLERCGHNPWKEKYARGRFFEILRETIEGRGADLP